MMDKDRPADEDFLRQLVQRLMRLDPRRCSDHEWMDDYARWRNEVFASRGDSPETRRWCFTALMAVFAAWANHPRRQLWARRWLGLCLAGKEWRPRRPGDFGRWELGRWELGRR
jgi:hypothetical protein